MSTANASARNASIVLSEHEQLSLQAPVVELLTATSGPCLSLQPVAVLTNQLGNTRFSLNREGGH